MCLNQKYITNRTLHFDLFKPLRIPVPCGKCEECKKVNRNEWFARCYFEWQRNKHVNTYFYTLTYNNENLPRYCGHQHFSKRHVQLFIKRLRSRLANYGLTLKYLVTCEFGELRGRCHYHILLFLSGSINPYWFYRFVEESWTYGFVKYGDNVGLVNSITGIQYVTKYVTKDYSHVDDILPVFAPLVYKRYYKLYKYVVQRWNISPAFSFKMNADFTFSRVFLNSSHDDSFFVQKFLTKMRRLLNDLLPFHLQSSRLGSNMVDLPNFDLEQVPILQNNGTAKMYKLPRYIKRLLWYDCIEGENSGKRDTFVLNDKGKQHLFSKLDLQVEQEKQTLLSTIVNISSLDDSFLPYLFNHTDKYGFHSIRDIVHWSQHLDLDFDVLAIYSVVLRGRVCTIPFDYLNSEFIKDNWKDYAFACIFDTCHFDYGEISKNYQLQKSLSHFLFNNISYLHVYEDALCFLNFVRSFFSTCSSDANVQKDKNARNLRQYLLSINS